MKNFHQGLNSYWRISTNPDTSKKKEPPETYAGVFYGPAELIYEKKLKFELGEKKFILYWKQYFLPQIECN